MFPFADHKPAQTAEIPADKRHASSPLKRIPLKFLRSVTPYPAGAVAGFVADVATPLVAEGAARFLTAYEREVFNAKLPAAEHLAPSTLEQAWAQANPKGAAVLKALDAEQREAAGLQVPQIVKRPPMYECGEKGCGFTADTVEAAQAHADDGREHLMTRLRVEGPLITPRQVLERQRAREEQERQALIAKAVADERARALADSIKAASQPITISSQEQHAALMQEAEALIEKDPKPGTVDHARLNALAIAIDTYERAHFPLDTGPKLEPEGKFTTNSTQEGPVPNTDKPQEQQQPKQEPPVKGVIAGAIDRALHGTRSKPPKNGQGK